MTHPDALDAATLRLARNMAITRVAMDTGQPVGLFALNIAALRSAIDGLELAFASVPTTRLVSLPVGDEVIDPWIADLIADATSTPAPDHLPDHWKDRPCP